MPDTEQTPGSYGAQRRGCICDRRLNNFGRGKSDPTGQRFFVAPGCRVHRATSTVTPEEANRLELARRGFVLIEIENLRRLANLLGVPIRGDLDGDQVVRDCTHAAMKLGEAE